ncbi:hypothetical protein CLOSTASPAR_01110 [[Clostridium] asparagiforme DSM 15981]|uniref:Uncharacterized protein n=1 Tax=[Clostridium] asparagiforme DSM 15981 TaxID=518636 RepID=C0CVV6_9FIRM|nr:hypothetical protein CLOSTASPAR_01110 [[Clostridium] asparagiforme DSM 15981]
MLICIYNTYFPLFKYYKNIFQEGMDPYDPRYEAGRRDTDPCERNLFGLPGTCFRRRESDEFHPERSAERI